MALIWLNRSRFGYPRFFSILIDKLFCFLRNYKRNISQIYHHLII